jgi:predicted transcriptional regulator
MGTGRPVDFHLNLNTETVEHAYSAGSVNLAPDATVRDAFHRMKELNTGAVLICQDEKLVGIFTERDALHLMARKSDLDVPLADHMIANPVTLSEEDTVGTGIAKMSRGGYRRLPIVDGDGQPCGVLKTSGILRYLVEHFPAVIYTLPPTPHQTTQHREGA